MLINFYQYEAISLGTLFYSIEVSMAMVGKINKFCPPTSGGGSTKQALYVLEGVLGSLSK